MIRRLRILLASRAHARAVAEFEAYQRQPATGAWCCGVACALSARRDRLAARLAMACL